MPCIPVHLGTQSVEPDVVVELAADPNVDCFGAAVDRGPALALMGDSDSPSPTPSPVPSTKTASRMYGARRALDFITARVRPWLWWLSQQQPRESEPAELLNQV